VPHSQPGPARSETARRAILDATARLFAANGYDRLTIEGVAAAAKVGKQTIYRWWGSKSALVAECLLEGSLFPTELNPPDSGDIRADLAEWLRAVFAFIDDPSNGDMARSLLAAATANADVGRLLGEALGAGSALNERLLRAQAAGQLPPQAPVLELGKAMVGYAIVHGLERAPTPPDLPERLVAGLVLSSPPPAD
jgi:AcrR family transcriptional regulator